MPKNPNGVQNNKTKLFIFCLYYEKMPKFIHFEHICYTRYLPNSKNRISKSKILKKSKKYQKQKKVILLLI